MGRWTDRAKELQREETELLSRELAEVFSSSPDERQARPTSPIPPGWLITYCGADGLLRGGSDGQGTVKSAVYSEEGWRFTVENGDVVALAAIKGVGQTDSSGKLVAAWLVNRFGYDGKKNDP